jgi:hypothetical protein
MNSSWIEEAHVDNLECYGDEVFYSVIKQFLS